MSLTMQTGPAAFWCGMSGDDQKPNWRIYYVDGSTYSNLDGPVEQSPADGVAVIVQTCEDYGRFLFAGADFYVWRTQDDFETWDSVKDGPGFGLWQYLLEPGFRLVRFGKTDMSNENYQKTYLRAADDPDFPRLTSTKKLTVPPWLVNLVQREIVDKAGGR